jgi:hypothetical protein
MSSTLHSVKGYRQKNTKTRNGASSFSVLNRFKLREWDRVNETEIPDMHHANRFKGWAGKNSRNTAAIVSKHFDGRKENREYISYFYASFSVRYPITLLAKRPQDLYIPAKIFSR